MTRNAGGEPCDDPLARRTRSTPDRIAVVDAEDGTSWRYDELDAEVEAVAGRLAGMGLGEGDQLGLLAETCVDAVRTIHAAWRLGLTLVPLNVRLAEPELARQVARSEPDALVCTDGTVETGAEIADSPVVTIGRRTDDDGMARPLSTVEPTDPVPGTWAPDDTALVLFTSGTTGEPKGVRLTMGNLLASATASAFRLGVLPSDRWLLCLPIYHMGGLAPVLRSAHYGTGLVVQEGFDPEAVTRATYDYDVTGLSFVPTMLRRILDSGGSLADSVRTVLLGGAPSPHSLIERCRRLDVPVYPTYGLTETASQVATATPEQAFAHEGTVGQPLLGTTVTVVDEALNPLPTGETGELVVSGPTVTQGYYGDRADTEGAFCEYGLRTGDLGRADEDGRLWVSGRLDDQIVSGGETVQPPEVATVLGDHPDVEAVAVVGLPDPEWGERVAALVVLRAGTDPDVDSLVDHCREHLASFKVPRTVAFADELPTTTSGTVDRAAVGDRLRTNGVE